MAADVDELLARADALPVSPAKTRDELVSDLEWHIRHAERMAATMPKEAAYQLALVGVACAMDALRLADGLAPCHDEIGVRLYQLKRETARREGPHLRLCRGGRDDA